MEEKKLTDEEALKAVEICHTFGIHCSTCPAYKYEADNCDNIAGLALVDYCRRLQDEIKASKLKSKELEAAVDELTKAITHMESYENGVHDGYDMGREFGREEVIAELKTLGRYGELCALQLKEKYGTGVE